MGGERGRPRNFDENAVLDRALGLFWRHGFQAASITDLTEVMGLNKPSFYAAFENKEKLYLRALDRYLQQEIARHMAVLDREPDGKAAVRAFLLSMATMLSDPAKPGGCFIINGSADCGGIAMPAAIEAALRKALKAGEDALKARIARAQREGQLSGATSASEMASVFSALLAGIAVQAKSGVKRARLHATVNAAMAVWP